MYSHSSIHASTDAHLKFDLLGYCVRKFQNVIKFWLSCLNFIKFKLADRSKNYSAIYNLAAKILSKRAVLVEKFGLEAKQWFNTVYKNSMSTAH